MTIETFQQPGALAPAGSLGGYLADYKTLREIMSSAILTEFVPAHFRPQAFLPKNERPTDAALAKATETAIVSACIGAKFGLSLGLGGYDGDPFMALQGVYVVSGRPSLYAEAMVSLVIAHGHEMWTEDSTAVRAVVCGRRKGSEHTERVIVTMDMAKKAGWPNRNPKYNSEPDTMLLRRAQSRCSRAVAPDALRGIRSREEMEDDSEVAVTASTRTVQRAVTRPELAATAPVAAPAPAPVRQAADVAPAAPSGPPLPGEDQASTALDERTWRRINARFVELGVTGPGQTERRLAVLSHIAERTITRGSELSEVEGQHVLANLGPRVIDEVLAAPAVEQPAEPDAADGPPLPGDTDTDTDAEPTLDEADDWEQAVTEP